MNKNLIIAIFATFFLSACGCVGGSCQRPQQPEVAPITVRGNSLPGTVSEPWVETMHDTIQVPGQIDPTNTYYRAPHKEVVEIRPGKYSGVRYDGEGK